MNAKGGYFLNVSINGIKGEDKSIHIMNKLRKQIGESPESPLIQ